MTAHEARITASAVREICGGVSDMTLWRWLQADFPKPAVINRRRYWRKSDVLSWLDAHQR